ncbi:MAG: DUF1732 domain-containing protein, partial [Acidobacteria bacterium]|nr:DUF1732 domain-containing protein [Acidobacteriota bacterium]
RAFRDAAREFGIVADPDLNAILRIPGAMDASGSPADGEFESVVLVTVDKALARLNEMREEEGRSIDLELRERMAHIEKARAAVAQHRSTVLDSYAEKLKSRLHELAGTQLDPDRIAQEVALLVDRSDVQEELVRLHAHVKHFLALLDQGGEIGKKLDFLLQEMNRESNTLLSKTSGLAGEALNITERGLAIKSEIEKAREQVQNLE